MALILAMQEGRAFYVGDTRVEVDRVTGPGQVRVKVVGAMISVHELSESHRVELLPDVFVQLGLGSGPHTIKVAIEAPRSVRVLRDSLYEQDGA